ncbi:disease resistance protein At4g27190-like [Magnolia sinica]|uniref:disease resistance protein At4g27190-like n=1 Tax=Magnolia sinica TaxID=86752 RepID=UPI00265803D3|nr:disease resistance protein At4g27190-like [Magnolia sinica]XP_058086118.1 disease resistance protein At4g27190-like [Magnolia sinica]XP_058086184.1 disease resistance protein At4g27190-like [Magnolia sinica]
MMDCFKDHFEVVKLLWNPLAQQIIYVIDLNKNVEHLKTKRDRLVARVKDVSDKVERAKLQRMVPLAEVSNWLNEVENVKNKVTVIENKFEEYNRCGIGCLRNYCIGWKLSKGALEKISEMDMLMENGLFEGGVAIDELPATAHTLPMTFLKGKTSAEKTLDQILDWIMDEKIGIIGIYGMGGVGKTTIMKNINNRLKDAKLFHSIIWVTVSQDLDLKRLQAKIAKHVKLDLKECDDDEESRATALHEALMKSQKFLLILDDMWKAFSLEKVGIPEPSEENDCKIALTTRSSDVCRGMKTKKTIRVETLSEEEAWLLFKDHIGSDMELDSDVEAVAELVVEECGGLPLALVTVGGALRDVDDIHEWRHALNQLRGLTTDIEGMQDNVFGRLKFSYDRLNDDKSRACFLYCSLYPEDYQIPVEEVIKYWIWEGLIDEVGDTEAEIDNGYFIVNRLVRACMLESGVDYNGIEFVKMHDLLRDMAIIITNHEPRFIVNAGNIMEESLKDEEWVKDVERVSLMYSGIKSLLETPNCCKLTTLFLQGNPLEGHITPSLFQHMCVLKVLDLSYASIKCLPDSLSNLVNLRALVLKCCGFLTTVPSLAGLNELRLLDLSSTAIQRLPPGMKRLKKLRFLDLSEMHNLKRIQAGLVSKLLRLEHFSALYSHCIQPFKPQERSLLDEITRLTRLVHLRLSFPNVATFLHYSESGQWQKLKKFSFDVGYGNRMSMKANTSLLQQYDLNSVKKRFLDSVERSVFVNDLQIATRKNPLLMPANTNGLCIYKCPSMEFIDNAYFLTALQHLSLHGLQNLQTFYQGAATPGAFRNLKEVTIKECHGLKNLFSVASLKNLKNLETIFICNCEGMEELVADEEEEEISEVDNSNNEIIITLPMLKILNLHKVWNLKKICGKRLVCSCMVSIDIKACHKLQHISLSISTTLSMTLEGEIRGTRKWWEALEWNDLATKPLLLPLFNEVGDDEDADETGLYPEDIELVMKEARVSRSSAVMALRAANGDIVSAIMELIE